MNKKELNLAEAISLYFANSRKHAFTLAEVLITLGIIGVVAALTIPNVTSLYRKNIVETRLAKFNTSINQAFKLSEVKNSDCKYWDPISSKEITDEEGEGTGNYTSNMLDWFNKYLRPYLNVIKVEETTVYENSIKVYFADGSLLLASHASWIFYPDAKYYEEKENANELNDRNREDSGIRWFTFHYAPSSYKACGVYPYYQYRQPSDSELRNNSSLGCRAAMVTNERAYCTLLIARNGWKIPKDYPLKF